LSHRPEKAGEVHFRHLDQLCLRPTVLVFCLGSLLSSWVAPPALAQSLRGSPSSLDRQTQQARQHDFTYVRRAVQLRKLVTAGVLVPVEGNRNYLLKGVSFEVARPEVKLFVERLGAQYRRACGEPLVVTSLTRPTTLQPGNASPRSVHPTGMAIDLRRPTRTPCRAWLESTLLSLETRGVLEATLERTPPHYHVALFPERYAAYVAGPNRSPRGQAVQKSAAGRTGVSSRTSHTVRPQETLWRISQRYGTTVAALLGANGLASHDIQVGQVLIVGPPAVARR
jgi:hypothetical protein